MKSKSILFALLLTSTALLAGCGSDDPSDAGYAATNTSQSMDASGNCTAQYIKAYNAILRDSKRSSQPPRRGNYPAVREQQRENDTLALQSSCREFFSVHDNISCVAIVGRRSKQVNSNDVRSTCAQVDASLENKRSRDHRNHNEDGYPAANLENEIDNNLNNLRYQ